MILIDTNYIIRLLSKEPDEHYKRSLLFFDKVAKGEIEAVISEGVIMECYFVLIKFYKFEKMEVIEFLSDILSFKNILSDDKHILLKALEILKDKNIDFIDALLCAKAKIYGYDIATFDKDLIKCIEKSQ